MKRLNLLLVGTFLTSACLLRGQSWFFSWDGTTDITCVPSADGNNAFFQGGAANSSFYWEVTDNGSGGKAFRQVVTSGTGFRWYGMGSRPEFYRGPCTAFAMENLRADHNAFTIAFRIKAESCNSTTKTRFFNCEFETTAVSRWWKGTSQEYSQTGGSYGPFLGFRVEFSLRNDSSGNLWLADHRTDQNIAILKTAGGQPTWHTVWATCELPPSPYPNPFSTYRIWIDGTEVAWDDRDRNGWSDCEVGWTPSAGRYATYALDYLCYTYGAYLPGSIAIPAERVLAPTNSIVGLQACADGTPCELTNKVVMAIFTNSYGMRFYYVGETNGADGIRLTHNTGKSPVSTGGSAVTLAVGDVVSVKGGLGSAEGEKQISAHEIARASTGTFTTVPSAVTVEALRKSYCNALYANTPAQLLPTPESGVVSSLTTNKIISAGKNWMVNQWKNATLFVPGTPNHTSLYYYVISNSLDTLTVSHRAIRLDFNNQPNLLTAGVQTGDSYEFVGGQAAAQRLDGRYVRTIGTVTAVNAAAKYFDINDGGTLEDIRTLQDIWDRLNYSGAWTSPAGLRVKWSGAMPSVGARLSLVGFASADRFKYQVTTTVDPNNSVRDEVKVDKVYPLLAARSFVPFTDPLITSARMTPTGFVANVAVIPGEPYRIRASADLQSWEDVTNFIASGTNYLFCNPAALTQPGRYYRAVSP
jgi:hypothetical protein